MAKVLKRRNRMPSTKSSGSSYETRDNLRVLVTAIERILTRRECKISIISDRKFSSKQILTIKPRRRRQQHEGMRPHQ